MLFLESCKLVCMFVFPKECLYFYYANRLLRLNEGNIRRSVMSNSLPQHRLSIFISLTSDLISAYWFIWHSIHFQNYFLWICLCSKTNMIFLISDVSWFKNVKLNWYYFKYLTLQKVTLGIKMFVLLMYHWT